MLNPATFDQERLVTSIHVSPKLLLGIRCIWLAYTIACMVGEFVWDAKHSWGYFTEWTWLGLIMYLTTAVFNGYLYVIKKEPVSKFEARSPWVKYFNWLLYVLPATYVYVVSVVFWALLISFLNDAPPLDKWLLVSQHSFNSIIMFSEMLLGRVPLAYVFIIPFFVIAMLYLVLAFLFHSWSGIWVYSFLDTAKPYWYLWYLGVLSFFLIEFVIVVFIHNARDRRRERLHKPILQDGEAGIGKV